MKRLCVFASGLLLALVQLGCSGPSHPDADQPPPADVEDPPGPGGFEARLLRIARTYESYGRADGGFRWAPAFCAAASAPRPARVRFSASADPATHGRKLYSLFVKDRRGGTAYTAEGKSNPVGQVVVKESWVPEEVKDDGRPLEPVSRKVKVRRGGTVVEAEDRLVPYARKGSRLYRAARRCDLFIMFKMEPNTPGTDAGWVYGTLRRGDPVRLE